MKNQWSSLKVTRRQALGAAAAAVGRRRFCSGRRRASERNPRGNTMAFQFGPRRGRYVEVVEATRGQHTVAGGHRQVAGARVLRQVPHVAADLDAAAVRQRIAGQHAQQRRLARAVTADEPDAVPGCDLEGGVAEQNPGAGM